MVFDGAGADSQMPPGLLVGSTGGELLQHFALSPGQRLATGEMPRAHVGSRTIGLLAALIGFDRLVEARHKLISTKRLLDEIQRAVLDRADRHGDVALSGDDEDWRRIVLAAQFLQDIQTGLAGNMHIQKNAGGGAVSRHRQTRGAVGKADDFVAPRRQDDGKGFADGRIVIADKDLTARGWLFVHATPSFARRGLPDTYLRRKSPPRIFTGR